MSLLAHVHDVTPGGTGIWNVATSPAALVAMILIPPPEISARADEAPRMANAIAIVVVILN
jgi:hypothetical protein